MVLLFVSPQSGQPLRGFPYAVKHLCTSLRPFCPPFYGVTLFSAVLVETWRAASPLEACSRPWRVETHSCVSSREFAISLTAYAGLSCLPRRKNASLHLQCAPSLLSSFCRDAARHVSIYNNVRARASLEEVQPSKGSGGMMRYCIRLGWLKPVRGFFFAKIREKCDSAKSFKEKVDNDTSRKVSAPP